MKRTFAQYQEKRTVDQFVEGLLDGSLTFEDFQLSLTIKEGCEESQIYNELLSGMANLAGAGLGAIGRGIGNVAGAVGRGASAVGNVANQAWQGAKQAGQSVNNVYQQGENLSNLKKAMGYIQSLQQSLTKMGLNNREVSQLLQRLMHTLQQGQQRVSQNNSLRFGQPGVWKKNQAPTQ